MSTEQQLLLEIEQDIKRLKEWQIPLESVKDYFDQSLVKDKEKIIRDFPENARIFLAFYKEVKIIIRRLKQNIELLRLSQSEDPFP